MLASVAWPLATVARKRAQRLLWGVGLNHEMVNSPERRLLQTVSNVLLQVNRQTTKAKSSKINAAATTKMVPDFLTYVRAGSRVRCEFSAAALIDDARPN